MTDDLRREAFETWLRGKQLGSTVGTIASACACPLAQFLREGGMPGVRVGATYYYLPGGFCIERARRLPAWALAFREGVDSLPGSAITAGRALKILQETSNG
jgi:hypothetical protein